ncbi:MAG TPA: DUF6362 family protein [Xanthobacteraceae bacterium]|nr:DUF6362 family protein [Xanthobacteraceae bacterium]
MGYLQTALVAAGGAYRPPHVEDEPDDAPIPATWTPAHVARRLIEAFRVDRRLPRIERPRAPGSAHPAMEYTREEMAEWEAIPIDPSRFAPTPDEIERMETAFAWLLIARESGLKYQFALRAWALRKSSGRGHRGSIRGVARKFGLSDVALLKRKDRALDCVAWSLNEKGVSVW